MKKILCIVLCLSLFLTLSPISYAVDVTLTEEVIFSGSFVDSDGITTRIDRIRRADGSECTKQYYNGDLSYITSSTIRNGNIYITSVDVQNNTTCTDTIPVASTAVSTSTNAIPLTVNAPKYFMGQIHYNTLYADGVPYTLQLGYYQQKISSQDVYKVLNSEAGKAIAFLIDLVSAAVSVYLTIEYGAAYDLVYALIQKAGITVASNIIQQPINEEYSVHLEHYDISVIDPDTSREQHFDGCRYRPLVDNSPVSGYHYDEFMPWNDTLVAYWLFTSFWPFNYPGVNRFA